MHPRKPWTYWHFIIIIPGLEFHQRSWQILDFYQPISDVVVSMTKYANPVSEQAEPRNDMTLVVKSNAYRRRSAKVKDEELALLAMEIAKLCEDLQEQ